MKKQLLIILSVVGFFQFVSAQIPDKGTPTRYGKYLLYCDWNSNKETNSTDLIFSLYDKSLKKVSENKVTIESFSGKFCYISTVFDKIPGSEWVEVTMKEKMMSSSAKIVRIDSKFNLIASYLYESKGPAAFHKESIVSTPINYLPLDHLTTMFGYEELDARTADGSLVYLNYDMSNIFCSVVQGSRYHGKLDEKVIPATLCYFQSGVKDFQLKWKLDIKEKHIVAYRVYLFENELFLYTSYFIGGENDFLTEQMLRKIDINTGTILYEVKLPSKMNFELMLSNVNYNKEDRELIISGDYMTTLAEKDQNTTTGPVGIFFIGKVDEKGICTMKEVELKETKPAEIKFDYLNVPFLSVKQLTRNKDGQYVAACQYNYLLSSKYCNTTYTASSEGTDLNIYKFIPAGLSSIVFDRDLNIVSRETEMLAFTSKNAMYAGYFSYVAELCILGTRSCDKLSYVDSYYDNETESTVITQFDAWQGTGDKNIFLFALKLNSGVKEYFKLVAEVPHTDKTTYTTFLMDPKSLVYIVTNQLAKNDFTKVDL